MTGPAMEKVVGSLVRYAFDEHDSAIRSVRLVKAMTRLGLTQTGLAEMLDVDVKTPHRWVAGKTRVPLVVVLYLELLGGEHEGANGPDHAGG